MRVDTMRFLIAAHRLGRASPRSRSRARHRLMLDALTANRSAAARCESPSATAARTRRRRSYESEPAITAGLRPAGSLNQISPICESHPISTRTNPALEPPANPERFSP